MIDLPLKTFLNLPDDKQKEIINVCLHEFSHYDFKSASLTRIVDRLNIAKGSFYRYFENKKDLYLYLMEFSKNLTSECGKRVFEESANTFFDAWLDYFLEMVQLEQEYPMIIRFKFKSAQERSSEFWGNKRLEAIKLKTDKTKVGVIDGQKNKQLRTDLSAEKLSMITQYYQIVIVDYLTIKHNLEFDEPLSSIPIDDMKRDIEEFISILKEGIEFKY